VTGSRTTGTPSESLLIDVLTATEPSFSSLPPCNIARDEASSDESADELEAASRKETRGNNQLLVIRVCLGPSTCFAPDDFLPFRFFSVPAIDDPDFPFFFEFWGLDDGPGRADELETEEDE
jgi:hypothetical protein